MRLLQSLLSVILIIIGALIINRFIEAPIESLWWIGKFFITLIILISIILFFVGLNKTKNVIVKSDTYKIASTQVWSVKKKVCPQITWKK